MKKLMFVLVVLALLVLPSTTMAGGPTGFDSEGNETGWYYSATCTNIQSGEIERSDGVVITTGFDEWGYNYQGHVFSGGYCDAYRDAAWCQPYKDIDLLMKWNEQWMANEDCDDDGALDRHRGFDSYIGSGAWETNQMSGEYVDDEGNTCAWNSFTKIIAVPADAYFSDNNNDGNATDGELWYTYDGTEIGASIWGQFAITMDIYNDTCTGDHGVSYASDAGVGFGPWQ